MCIRDRLTQSLQLLGEVTNTQERAASLEAYYDQKKEELTKALAGTDTPSVYLAGTGSVPVSYTHLDVYKRQHYNSQGVP